MNLRNLRSQNRRKKRGISLDIINLIDVMLVLLIFFMATTTFMTVNDSIKLKLPQSSIISQSKPKQIVVSVSEDKKIFINETPVLSSDFVSKLSEYIKNFQTGVVLIKGDKDLSYGYLVQVMTLAKEAGATDLDIATVVPDKGV